MTKRELTSIESFELRQILHVAVLDALMASRRWEPGDLVFHGGTSLHLAHGSPRFSEDLDFMVNSGLALASISEAVEARLGDPSWMPADAELKVTKAKEGRNPHTFVVSVGSDELMGSVKVKVELWKAPQSALNLLSVAVAPIRLTRGPAAGVQTFVPTSQPREIYVDKIFALAGRDYLKARDVFALYWLTQTEGHLTCSALDIATRFAIYPNQARELDGWVDKAFERRLVLQESTSQVLSDLQRWLPSTWRLDEELVGRMVTASVTALEEGIDAAREYVPQPKGPAP
jgi:predicted nucleotidyltransferase component of viral defense system